MSDFVWWSIFLILVACLIVLSVRLCRNILNDYLCDTRETPRTTNDSKDDYRRYQTTSHSIFTDVNLTNNSERSSVVINNEDDKANLFGYHSVQAKDSSDGSHQIRIKLNNEGQNGSLNNLLDNHSVIEKQTSDARVLDDRSGVYPEESEVEIPKNEVAKSFPDEVSVDSKSFSSIESEVAEEKSTTDPAEQLANLSQEEREILEKILGIEGEANIYAKQIPYCLGGKQHLPYYELNQKFIENLINLGSIECSRNDKLKNRKRLVSVYIQECQEQLKIKAAEFEL